MSLYLTEAKRRFEAYFSDTCRITHDVAGAEDEVLNPATGALTAPVGQPTTVYEGPCLFRWEEPRSTRSVDEAGETLATARLGCFLPIESAVPVPGDIVEVLTASIDPQLVDERFTVLDTEQASIVIARRLVLERYTHARPRR